MREGKYVALVHQEQVGELLVRGRLENGNAQAQGEETAQRNGSRASARRERAVPPEGADVGEAQETVAVTPWRAS